MVKMLETLEEYNAATKETCVIDFTATWCPPCQMIGPKFVAMSEEDAFKGVTFYKLDVDANSDGSQAAGISCMPTFMFYKGGSKVNELQGANEGKLREHIAELAK